MSYFATIDEDLDVAVDHYHWATEQDGQTSASIVVALGYRWRPHLGPDDAIQALADARREMPEAITKARFPPTKR